MVFLIKKVNQIKYAKHVLKSLQNVQMKLQVLHALLLQEDLQIYQIANVYLTILTIIQIQKVVKNVTTLAKNVKIQVLIVHNVIQTQIENLNQIVVVKMDTMKNLIYLVKNVPLLAQNV